MIKKWIARLKREALLIFILRLFLLLSFYILISVAVFVLIYGVLLSIVLSVLFFFFLVWGIVRFSAFYLRDRRSVERRLEEEIFGERRLVIDSLEEFSAERERAETVRRLELALRSEPGLKKFAEKRRKIAWRYPVFLAGLIVVILFLLFIVFPAFNSKLKVINEFYQFEAVPDVPVYYIEGKELELDFSSLIEQIDILALGLSNRTLESSSGFFVLDEGITSEKQIEMELLAYRFGLKRSLYKGTMTATSKLLPNKINMTVVYPFKSESYSGLQDIEMWKGGRLSISGNFTRPLASAELLPDGDFSVSLDENEFTLSFYPGVTTDYTLAFSAVNGDSYNTHSFTVKTVANNPPTIKLIYPIMDITLNYYEWTVNSIVEAEDDQGISTIYCDILITNRDPWLSYNKEEHYQLDGAGEKYIKDMLKLTYQDLMILPNDCAAVEFYAEDVFGAMSETVGFYIISPDLLEISMEREEIQSTFESSIESMEQQYSELEEDIEEGNLAGTAKNTEELAEQMSKLDSSMSALEDNYARDQNSIEDIREAIETMKELTEKLKENADELEEISKMLQNEDMDFEDVDLENMDFNEMLEELKSLLKTLDYYEEYSQMVNQFQILENSYETLKDAGSEEDFERAMESYQNELDNFSELDNEELASILEELSSESEGLEMDNPESFERSDELMEELEEKIQEQVGQASQNRMQESQDVIEEAIAELFLDLIVLDETLAIDTGDNDDPIVDALAEVVQNVNSVNKSVEAVETDVFEALEGMLFTGNRADELEGLFEETADILDEVLDGLRDNEPAIIESGLQSIANQLAAISLDLILISDALETAMQSQSAGQGQATVKSMSVGDLMMMQSMVSRSLEQMLQQMQQQGGASSEMQELMDELAELQKQIREGLGELMRNTEEGAITGGDEMSGMMDDIIEDLEGYNIDQDTLEASEELEEKLLDSVRALESKGVSDERKSETGGDYSIEDPGENETGLSESYDLDDLGERDISEYYWQLIERYLGD